MSLSCVARPPQSVKFGIFTSYWGQRWQRNVQESMLQVQSSVLFCLRVNLSHVGESCFPFLNGRCHV